MRVIALHEASHSTMSNGAGDGHNEQPHHGHKPGLKRRILRWWYSSGIYRGYCRLAEGLYNWWHPISDRSRSYYGRYGRSRHSRQSVPGTI